MKTAQKPQATESKQETVASQAVKPAETVQTEVLPKVESVELVIPGNRISLEMLNSRVQKAAANAGRLKAKAIETGNGRLIKDMSGHGTIIPTVATLQDMAKQGLLGDNPDKVKAAIVEARALNNLIDALCDLGLARRTKG